MFNSSKKNESSTKDKDYQKLINEAIAMTKIENCTNCDEFVHNLLREEAEEKKKEKMNKNKA